MPDNIDNTPSPPIQAPTKNASTSLAGTSAPLLTNPSLTDMLSNFPIWPLIDDGVPNPTVEDNGTESPKCDDERGLAPPVTIPAKNGTTTTKLSSAPRGYQHKGP